MTWLDALVSHAHAGLKVAAREHLCQRGVSDAQIDSFQMGCLHGAELPDTIEYPPRFRAWWTSHQAQFKNALVFPLTSTLGAIHGLQFRDLDPKTRGYLDYYEVKEEPAFFGLAQAMPSAWTSEEIWLVEGVFDLCPIQRHIPNSISTLHAGVSKSLARVLRRVARFLVVAYDMDSTGLTVAYDLAREMKGLFEVAIVKFPRVRLATGVTVKDPNELWAAWGDAALGAFLQRNRPSRST